MGNVILLPICVTKESFPHHTISKERQPLTMPEDEFWDNYNYVEKWQWVVVDNRWVKAFGFSYDCWRIIEKDFCR